MQRGKSSIDEVLSSLPSELSAIVRRVVRRSRLWRGEKADVCRELGAHFLDGLEALQRTEGLDSAAAAKRLAEAFGDPDVAARLIRRSKKRCRPMVWKIWVRSCQAAACLVLLLVVRVGWLCTGQIRPTVDYLAVLNEKAAAVPEEDRAWPFYSKALGELSPFPESVRNWRSGELGPWHEQWDKVQEWVDQNATALTYLAEGGKKPHLGRITSREEDIGGLRYEYRAFESRRAQYPTFNDFVFARRQAYSRMASENGEIPFLVALPVPPLEISSFHGLLSYRARAQLAGRQYHAAVETLCLAHRVGTHFLEDVSMIPVLTGEDMIKYAGRELRQVLADHGKDFSPAYIRGLSHQWAGHLPSGSVDTAFLKTERLVYVDAIQHVFTESGDGNGHWRGPQGGKVRLLPFWVFHADRKATIEKMSEWFQESEEPLSRPLYDPARRGAERHLEKLAEVRRQNPPFGNYWDNLRYSILSTVSPARSSYKYKYDALAKQTSMDHQATLVVMALTAYRNERGAYPKALAELVPVYLPNVPEDVYDGKPLKYRLDDDGKPVLYSIWENFVDDGGQAVSPKANNKGDMVYWPVMGR